MTDGDLVLVPVGGTRAKRLGERLARVICATGLRVSVKWWQPSTATWSGVVYNYAALDCVLATIDHPKVRAMLRGVEKRAIRARAS